MSYPFIVPKSLGTRRLFLDLDGVMADFDEQFRRLFGKESRDQADDALWAAINSSPTFFFDMPMCPGAAEFFAAVRHLDPMILTACPKDNYRHAALQKKAWVRKHLSADILVLPTAGGSSKPLFIHQAGDVLIDDFARNCEAWRKDGGVAIRHRAFPETTSLLWCLGDGA